MDQYFWPVLMTNQQKLFFDPSIDAWQFWPNSARNLCAFANRLRFYFIFYFFKSCLHKFIGYVCFLLSSHPCRSFRRPAGGTPHCSGSGSHWAHSHIRGHSCGSQRSRSRSLSRRCRRIKRSKKEKRRRNVSLLKVPIKDFFVMQGPNTTAKDECRTNQGNKDNKEE